MNPGCGSDLTIILLGHTGAGKSASGNTILGSKAFVSKASFKPVTTQICEKTGNVFEKLIRVIDTPGILQDRDTEDEIKTCCQCVLSSSRPCLFLVVVSVTRFTSEQEQAVRKTIQVLGDDGTMDKSFMLFTSGDTLYKTSVDNFIFEDEEGSLPEIVRRFPGYHLFNNEGGGRGQVKELLIKSGHLQPSEHGSHLAGSSSGAFFSLEEMRIILTGLPGSGKSSSGNTILGSNRFKSGPRFQAFDTKCVCESAKVDGQQVTVVDAPGFTDELQTLQQLYADMTKTIAEAKPGPHAFVIVVKIGRISRSDSVLLKMLSTLLSYGAHEYTTVLFTHGDELKGQSIDDMIQSNSSVSELVSVCGQRYSVFDNRGREMRQQVQKFMSKMDKMVRANGGRYYTSNMFQSTETRIRAAERTRVDQAGGARDITQAAQTPLQLLNYCYRVCCCCRSTSGSGEEQHLLESFNYGTFPET